MTPVIVRALEAAAEAAPEDFGTLQLPSEPSLVEAQAGKPIAHGQLIELSRLLKKHALPISLDALLRGSGVYIAPPPPKQPQTSEYRALMARLRAEEEARVYERMTNPSASAFSSTSHLPKPGSFSQRFPDAPFSVGTGSPATDEDELTYEEVHRQIILIINVLVSVIACAVFIWVAARHWSAPKRLGLSMGGSGAVAVAEVVVYSGYVRKIAEAKRREKKRPEIKQIMQSWVIEGSGHVQEKTSTEDGVRYRKGKHR
ncbi:hypothetical protein P280DRAFT_401675 [Massarina eburnea CBS 473.64]|uniref:Endoplasmic reticulum-based factor for assembly of V-ATPase-domain-containing protein n=1 Tax=Massarina eburnea CBS 473.64 TaxID=1395130 RepID=A0A6A6RWL7_9PLEO|nr:hypothetical protein P280DRAFT_401675 [Massarina eburnea CBS 473.64]